MDDKTWAEIERVARKCQSTWGMGFPVISTYLLRKIIDGEDRNEQACAHTGSRGLHKGRVYCIACGEYLLAD